MVEQENMHPSNITVLSTHRLNRTSRVEQTPKPDGQIRESDGSIIVTYAPSIQQRQAVWDTHSSELWNQGHRRQEFPGFSSSQAPESNGVGVAFMKIMESVQRGLHGIENRQPQRGDAQLQPQGPLFDPPKPA